MTFFKTTRGMLFQSYVVQDCFQLMNLLFCWKKKKATNPEFDNDRFELANVYNCKFKAHFMLRTSAEVSWSTASPWKILLFSETKRRKPQRCTSERHLKDERKTNITSNLNLAVLHDSSLSLSAAHFLIIIYSIQLKKENYFSRSMELDGWLSSRLKKTTKILLTIYLVLI